MKKSIIMLSLILSLIMVSSMVFAEGEILVRIDSNNVSFEEAVAPFIDDNNRTQVPFRATMEAFGAEVEWNNETRTAIAKKGDITVEVPIGELYVLKNGEKVESDTVAVIKDNSTYLPIRKVVEAFGAEVQWDKDVNTVVITTEPIDAKKVLLESYAKSYDWKNYDMNMLMNMSMPIPTDTGDVGEMTMNMDMKMTAFMDPIKAKASANMAMDMGGESLEQPLMEMYYTLEDNKFITYMGMYNATGELSWMKSELEDEIFSQLLNYDNEKNKELNEQSIKEVRYLGKYTDEADRILLKFENTTSFEAYNELMGGYMNMLSASGKQEDLLAADMLKNLDDILFVVYVDEASGEIVKYEMDLSSFMGSMLEGLMSSLEVPAEEMEMLKSLKIDIEMEVSNVNKAEDFKIPKEALDAKLVEDILTEEKEAE